MPDVVVIGPKDRPNIERGALLINTTSRSDDWGKAFSPFLLGPCDLYWGMKATNVENGWQFSKVYMGYANGDAGPSEEYFKWALLGWSDKKAHRYPMGKRAKPLYSFWDNQILDYIDARKQIYIPLYRQAVTKTQEFDYLKQVADSGRKIYLWDFDGYDHRSMGRTLVQVANDPKKTMGHAFVIAMLLEGYL